MVPTAAASDGATSTLTVFSTGGLGNRLRTLLSGTALAEASGRTFTMIWNSVVRRRLP